MMDVYLCVIKHSDVLLICKTGAKCTFYVKHLCLKKAGFGRIVEYPESQI